MSNNTKWILTCLLLMVITASVFLGLLDQEYDKSDTYKSKVDSIQIINNNLFILVDSLEIINSSRSDSVKVLLNYIMQLNNETDLSVYDNISPDASVDTFYFYIEKYRARFDKGSYK